MTENWPPRPGEHYGDIEFSKKDIESLDTKMRAVVHEYTDRGKDPDLETNISLTGREIMILFDHRNQASLFRHGNMKFQRLMHERDKMREALREPGLETNKRNARVCRILTTGNLEDSSPGRGPSINHRKLFRDAIQLRETYPRTTDMLDSNDRLRVIRWADYLRQGAHPKRIEPLTMDMLCEVIKDIHDFPSIEATKRALVRGGITTKSLKTTD